jgi:hypothetical protein
MQFKNVNMAVKKGFSNNFDPVSPLPLYGTLRTAIFATQRKANLVKTTSTLK